jgi:hypothetical protein
MQRHRVTGSFGFKDFEGSSEESGYWNRASEEEKQSLKKKHVATGQCLLCMIDELLPQQKEKQQLEPERIIIETEPKKALRESGLSIKKVSGGIINRSYEKTEATTQNLKVSWAWHFEDQGIVAWTFQNTGSQQATGILFRNSYYFGNTFWPIYQNNLRFGVAFATKLEPLPEKSIQGNSAPLGIVSWKQQDGSYKNIVCFVFTLSPGQTWQMLEGGFSRVNPPQNVSIHELSLITEADFIIGFDRQHVDTWTNQTGASDGGYAPNPSKFKVVQLLAPTEAPYAQLFENDSVHQGELPLIPKEEAVEEKHDKEQEQPEQPEQDGTAIELTPEPSSASGNESRFWSLMGKGSGALSKK